ncbi:MAG: hypothetical protein R3348_00585 [Xanthomonadales bacterium]|nr:hypothetical protein [Xanthomonadales bacterium]
MTDTLRAAWAMYAVILAYPLLSLVFRQDLSFLTPEVLLALGTTTIAALALGWAHAHANPWVGGALVFLALAAAFMMQFDLRFEGLLALLGAVVLLTALARARLPLLLVPVIAAMIVGAWLDARLERRPLGGEKARAAVAAKPVIHLVMDSFPAPGGMPDTPDGAALADLTEQWFTDNGFRLFTRAYSRYSTTVDSLHNAFNFQHGPVSRLMNDYVLGREHRLGQNRYFDEMAGAGYRIRVYQNEEMRFCEPEHRAFAPCWTHPLPNLGSVEAELDGAGQRLRQMVSAMMRRSRLLAGILDSRGLLPPFGISVYEPDMLAQLAADAATSPYGVLYFAHVLFPHSPWVYDEGCRADYSSPPELRFSRYGDEQVVSPARREARTSRFIAQARCTLLELQKLFEALERSGVFEQAHVIVHGDHGSQVTEYPIRTPFREQLNQDDLRHAFSALFAYRPPGGAPGLDHRVLPLEELMFQIQAQVLGKDVTITPGPRGIYLSGENPMPFIETQWFNGE